ncbi:MAG: hypothetical protein ACFFEF_08860 [Candidatus Thorarchaeota archaeon]
MQEGDVFYQLILLAGIALAAILFIILIRFAQNYTSTAASKADAKAMDGDHASQGLLARIRSERQKAQHSLEQGELRNARDELSKLLQSVSEHMSQLIVFGPENSIELRDEIEYTLDETTARLLLDDLRDTSDSLDELYSDDINVWSEERLEEISSKAETLAENADEIAKKRRFDAIRKEVQVLRTEIDRKVQDAKFQLKKPK